MAENNKNNKADTKEKEKEGNVEKCKSASSTPLSTLARQQSTAFEEHIFDEPDDELEEFDNFYAPQLGEPVECEEGDSEVNEWEESWDAAGWDDEDVDDEFLTKLREELNAFKAKVSHST